MKSKSRCWIWVVVILMVFPDTTRGITIHEEEKLSREFMVEVNEQLEIINDSIISNYITEIGNRILSVMPPQPFQYKFYVIKETTYNAFAGPAGHIFINSGLFEALDTEEELAGILAHEIAHVSCRHVAEKIERSKKIGLATLAGIAAGILMGATGGSGSTASAAAIGSIAAAQTLTLAYSREDEMQADLRGIDYMTRAGYNPKGLLVALNKIRNKQWYGKEQVPTYLMTHPAVEDRIAFIGSWMEANPGIMNQLPKISKTSFNWTHTRLTAMFGSEDEALRKFRSGAEKNHEDPLMQYGYGLILSRTGNRTAAIEHFRSSLTRRAFDPLLLIELGKTYFMDGRLQESLSVLKSALEISSDEPEGLYYAARCLMALGRFEESARMLETLLRNNPQYTEAIYYLGSSYGSLGRIYDACYYLGIFYKTRGDHKNAIAQLEKAYDMVKDPQKKTEIETLLKESKKRHTIKMRESDMRRRQ